MIYLDNAATTKTDTAVLNAMLPYYMEEFGNPSAANEYGERAREAIADARKKVADFVHVTPEEIFFTSGATEANNWIIFLFECTPGNVGFNPLCHPSITERVHGYPFDGTTFGNATNILVHNETGEINKERYGSGLNHMDATQAVHYFPHFFADKYDAVTFSGHKINGPKGVGVLYLNKDSHIYEVAERYPFICGGHQQNNFRSGTENVPAIVGMGEACRLWNGYWSLPEISGFRDLLLNIDGSHINGNVTAEHIISIRFDKVNGEELMYLLAERGVIVSTGSACHNNQKKRSAALKALGLSDEQIDETIRISIGKDNTEEELEQAAEIIADAVEDLRL